jgi:hypothetical protein
VELLIKEETAKLIKINLPKSAARDGLYVISAGLIDVSVLGCGIDSPYLFPQGVSFDLTIDPKSFSGDDIPERKEPIKAVGRVASCVMKSAGHYRIGICFTSVDKETHDFLDSFIKVKERRKDPRWDMTK